MTNRIVIRHRAMGIITNKKVTDSILDHIRKMVEIGELREGDKLPNQYEFAAQLGVSRPSLREALYTLKQIGAIEQRPGYGTVLRSGTATLLACQLDLPFMSDSTGTIELMETRCLLEVGVVELAAKRATEKDLDRIEGVLREMSSMVAKGKREEYRKKDLEFHQLIAMSAHNRFLLHIFLSISQFLEQFLKDSFSAMPHKLGLSQQGHDEIYMALRNRDPKRATHGMFNHLSRVIQSVESYYGQTAEVESID